MEEEKEGFYTLKIIIISICALFIISFIIFFIGICRVDAAENSGIYDRSASTSTEVKSSSTNSINIWTGQTGTYTGSLSNWNQVGVYYHTNLSVTNGHTYNFQFVVTIRLQPILPSVNPCSSWNISAFSIRYPTTLDNMASNQVTLTESNLSKSSCIISGSNENIQTVVYTFTGKFTANRTTNILGARFQIYTSETRYVQSIYSNMALTITEVDTSNGDVIGAINNSTSAQIQNDNSNTNKIIDAIKGESVNFEDTDNQFIDDLSSNESRLNSLKTSESTFSDNVSIGTGVSSQDYDESIDFIERCWNLFLQHQTIMALMVSILSLGIIAHLTNRS